MLTTAQIESYREIGYLVVPDVIGPDVLAKARAKLAELIEKSREVTASDAIYDLEDAHTPRNPRVRRIKDPHINGEVYNNLLRSPQIMDLVSQLIGPDLRMDHTKLNIKPARGGEPVEWHQDWAFYPAHQRRYPRGRRHDRGLHAGERSPADDPRLASGARVRSPL